MPNSLRHTSAPLSSCAFPDCFLKKSFGSDFYQLNKPAQASILFTDHNRISWWEQQSPWLNSLIKRDAAPGAAPLSLNVLSLAFPGLVGCPLQPAARWQQGTRAPGLGRAAHDHNSCLSFLHTPPRCPASREWGLSLPRSDGLALAAETRGASQPARPCLLRRLPRGQRHTAPAAPDTVPFVTPKPLQREHHYNLWDKSKKLIRRCWKFTDAFHENSSFPYTALVSAQFPSQTLSLFAKQENLFILLPHSGWRKFRF